MNLNALHHLSSSSHLPPPTCPHAIDCGILARIGRLPAFLERCWRCHPPTFRILGGGGIREHPKESLTTPSAELNEPLRRYLSGNGAIKPTRNENQIADSYFENHLNNNHHNNNNNDECVWNEKKAIEMKTRTGLIKTSSHIPPP